MVGKRVDPREQLIAERLDAIDRVGGALLNTFEALLLLREPPIDPFEALENLRPHLLQPQHGSSTCHDHARGKPPSERHDTLVDVQELIAADCRR
jgi:hypothetical protein